MKTKLSQMLLTLIASLILYGGAGVYMVSFCCEECREGGIGVVLSDSCCEVHNHAHCTSAHDSHTSSQEKNGLESICMSEEQCSIARILFDWSNTEAPTFVFQVAVIDLLSDLCSELLFIPLSLTENEAADGSLFFLHHTPRGYLSLLSVLLI